MTTSRQKPNKVLSAQASAITGLESWMYEDYPGDPYWSGGTSPKPYRWEITVIVTPQVHGDTSTNTPSQYNGTDVFVGDWIADQPRGRSFKVVDIVSKAVGEVTCVVEDVDRYNTFNAAGGNAMFQTGDALLIFTVNENKMPILNPLPASFTDVTFSSEVNGRFLNNNPLYDFRVFKTAHGFQANQTIWVNPASGDYEVATGENLKRMVGVVSRTGPGLDIFYFRPTTKVIEQIEPALPGSAGDIIYINSIDGTLTTTPSATVKEAYIQLDNTVGDSTMTTTFPFNVQIGWQVNVNGAPVTFTGTDTSTIVTDFNNQTPSTLVSASAITGINTATTNAPDLVYALVAMMGDVATATINGVQVNFDITLSGTLEFGFTAANAEDMAASINAANIPNISAIGVGSTSLTIANDAGGAITIVNGTGDTGSTPFAGAASGSGVPLSTAPGGDDIIEFSNAEGTGIVFQDSVGSPIAGLGLQSARNGSIPSGLVIEQFVTTSNGGTVKVYATLGDLPASGEVGEQAYVIDSDDGNGSKVGEWTLFMWDGSVWVKLADEDSASTDANSITLDITPTSAASEVIGTVSDGSRVVSVSIEVITPFDGAPSLTIGDNRAVDSLMSDALSDLGSLDTYLTSSGYVYQTGQDVDISSNFTVGGATTGLARIVVSYQ